MVLKLYGKCTQCENAFKKKQNKKKTLALLYKNFFFFLLSFLLSPVLITDAREKTNKKNKATL